ITPNPGRLDTLRKKLRKTRKDNFPIVQRYFASILQADAWAMATGLAQEWPTPVAAWKTHLALRRPIPGTTGYQLTDTPTGLRLSWPWDVVVPRPGGWTPPTHPSM